MLKTWQRSVYENKTVEYFDLKASQVYYTSLRANALKLMLLARLYW